MCLAQALKKCKTEEQRQATIATYKALLAAVEAEQAGDSQAMCRLMGHHGSWIKRKEGWLCASCSNIFADKDQADKELKHE